MNANLLTQFAADGFVVLRAAFDPGPLVAEVERVLSDGVRGGFTATVGDGEVRATFAPMMAASTPTSLQLVERFAGDAAEALGVAVLPVRAKAVRYEAATPWHVDSVRPLRSVGFLAYLQPMREHGGALRVLPGSHRALQTTPMGFDVGVAVETDPGDVLVMDEHLWHASAGGKVRRQWRIDFVEDARGARLEAELRAYFSGLFPADWDGGYDATRYPSYGADWCARYPRWAARLGALGAIEAARRHEAPR